MTCKNQGLLNMAMLCSYLSFIKGPFSTFETGSHYIALADLEIHTCLCFPSGGMTMCTTTPHGFFKRDPEATKPFKKSDGTCL